jgi:hypothetical protein
LLAAVAWLPAAHGGPGAQGRAPPPWGWGAFIGSFVLLHLCLISAWGCWWGGYCWGSRLATEPVVFAALLCLRPLAALRTTKVGRGLVATAVVLGCLLHLPAVYLKAASWYGEVDVPRHPEALWRWSDPPFFAVFRRHRTAESQ